jgi:hypothetical protein
VIMTAVEARHPKRRYTAGADAAVFAVLAHAPASLRERLVKTALGLG